MLSENASTTAPMTANTAVTIWRRRRSRALCRWSRGTISTRVRCSQSRIGLLRSVGVTSPVHHTAPSAGPGGRRPAAGRQRARPPREGTAPGCCGSALEAVLDFLGRVLDLALGSSPACLVWASAWSALPSAFRSSSPVARPVVSLAWPVACSALFFALSPMLIMTPSSLWVSWARTHWAVSHAMRSFRGGDDAPGPPGTHTRRRTRWGYDASWTLECWVSDGR